MRIGSEDREGGEGGRRGREGGEGNRLNFTQQPCAKQYVT